MKCAMHVTQAAELNKTPRSANLETQEELLHIVAVRRNLTQDGRLLNAILTKVPQFAVMRPQFLAMEVGVY
jgi:hypothetical protein